MSKRTKKVGTSGRYQARYGVRSRTRVREVETIQRAKQICPACGHLAVHRLSSGIWQCKKCGCTFAGGAYTPKTEAGQTFEKVVKAEEEVQPASSASE
ncbi:MAG: 50S ribosomal protein L37ae [Methanobacteriota archaeon]